MKYTISAINNNNSIKMTFNSREEFFRELSFMSNDFFNNGASYFDIKVNVDTNVSSFYNLQEENPRSNYNKIYQIVDEWFGYHVSEEDCENIAQRFAIGFSKGQNCYSIFEGICKDYSFYKDEFEGICAELENIQD